MAQRSQVKRKAESYRQRIRREKIESFFAQQRALLLDQREDEQTVQLRHSITKQKQFLDSRALELTGEPSAQWLRVIYDLNRVITAFNGQFQYWFSSSIIKMLAQALKQPYTPQLKIAPAISNLLSDMISLSLQQGTNFARKLIEYEFSLQLIVVGGNYEYNIRERLQMLNLCAHLCYAVKEFRKDALRDGAGVWLVLLGKEIIENYLKQQQICRAYLGAVSVFLNFQNHQYSVSDIPNLNIIHEQLPIISAFLFNPFSSESVICLALKNLAQVMRYDRYQIYEAVLSSPNVVKKIIELIADPHHEVRNKALFATQALTFYDKAQVAPQLVDFGVLGQIYQAWKLQQNNKKNYVGRFVMSILSNLSDSSQKITNHILEQPVFEIVLQQISNSQIQNRKEGYYCLNTLIRKATSNNFLGLIVKYELLNHLILGLTQMKSIDAESTKQILQALTALAEKAQTIYFNRQGNMVIEQMQSTYRLTSILDEIMQNQNNTINFHLANSLHHKIASRIWNNGEAI